MQATRKSRLAGRNTDRKRNLCVAFSAMGRLSLGLDLGYVRWVSHQSEILCVCLSGSTTNGGRDEKSRPST